jgi:hypothetical protein
VRINYTLPGYQPETDATNQVTDSFDSPFQNRMRAFERREPVAWRDLFGLNKTPADPGQVGPPPRSKASETADLAIIRQQWRQLLGRHSGHADLQNAAPPVRRMLGLLQRQQEESDKLISRGLAESGI